MKMKEMTRRKIVIVVGLCLTGLPMISQFYAVRAYPNETCIVKYEFICI